MFIPTFPTMEQATRYAEIHTPLKRAMEAHDHLPIQYGAKAAVAGLECFSAANSGDQAKLLKSMRALSWALPPNCFGR